MGLRPLQRLTSKMRFVGGNQSTSLDELWLQPVLRLDQ